MFKNSKFCDQNACIGFAGSQKKPRFISHAALTEETMLVLETELFVSVHLNILKFPGLWT
jgi:hypothetical protein